MENPWRAKSTINPQRNYRREINSEVWQALIRARLTGAEYQIVLTVIDRSWGYNKLSALVSLGKFENETRLTRQGIIRAIKSLERICIIVRQKDGTKTTEYLFNKHFDTWKVPRTSQPEFTSRDKELVNQSSLDKSTVVDQTSQLAEPTTEPVKKPLKKDIYIVIFDQWNSKGIRVHRKLTDDMKRAINARSKDFSLDEILQSIDNYALILHGEEYELMTYRWTLTEFLTGERVEKFLDLEIAKSNYRKDKRKSPERKSQFGDGW